MVHFFETDLPLPIARKLHVEKFAPPERVAEARAEIAALIAGAGCGLSDEEREALEVGVEDEWYRRGRSAKLHQFEHMLKFASSRGVDGKGQPVTAITAEMFTELASACFDFSPLCYLARSLLRLRDDGVLAIDVLLQRGLQRIGEHVPTRARVLWDEIATLGRSAPDEGEEGEEDDEAEAARPAAPASHPPRDLLALAHSLDLKALDNLSKEILRIGWHLGIPDLHLHGWERSPQKKEREADLAQLKAAAGHNAAEMARACLDRLYPAAPRLARDSGVHPDSLRLLLRWREEYGGFSALSAQLSAQVEDLERLVWMRGRHLIRTVLADYAAAILATEDDGRRFTLLFEVECALRQMHRSPPPELVNEWIQARRDQVERTWRVRLGCNP